MKAFIKNWWKVSALVLLVIAIWYNYPALLIYYFSGSSTVEFRAQFGDSYGALNTLFSGLAFTGIIVSIFLQSKELKATQKEFSTLADESSKQREQFEKQAAVMDRQLFENAFFQLLNLHIEMTSSIVVGPTINQQIVFEDTSEHIGKSAIKELYVNRFMEGTIGATVLEANPLDNANFAYLAFYDRWGDILGAYFRNLYQILKYIDNRDLADKKMYSNILRAQLSKYELGLLFFNCVSDVGKKKLKPLIERFEFFENLPKKLLIKNEFILFYDVKAYGKDSDLIELYNQELKNNAEV